MAQGSLEGGGAFALGSPYLAIGKRYQGPEYSGSILAGFGSPLGSDEPEPQSARFARFLHSGLWNGWLWSRDSALVFEGDLEFQRGKLRVLSEMGVGMIFVEENMSVLGQVACDLSHMGEMLEFGGRLQWAVNFKAEPFFENIQTAIGPLMGIHSGAFYGRFTFLLPILDPLAKLYDMAEIWDAQLSLGAKF